MKDIAIRNHVRPGLVHQAIPAILGAISLGGAGALFVWELFPGLFPAGAHGYLASFPLAMIALAYVLYRIGSRPSRAELAKAIVLAVAFLFWAANQLWPDPRQATVFNDIAIALFILDSFLVIVGRPASRRASDDDKAA